MKPIAAWRGEGVRLRLRNRQRTRPIDVRFLRRLVRFLLRPGFGCERAELGIHLISAPAIARLNQRFLGHAGPTDVITFDYGEERPFAGKAASSASARSRLSQHNRQSQEGPPLQGDLLVCVDVAVAQARRYRTTWQKELVRYVIHGLLHLHGYDDSTLRDRRRMKRAEDRLLRRVERSFALTELSLATPRARSAKHPSKRLR